MGSVSILVGTPCAQGGLTEQYLSSVLALKDRCRELGWELSVVTRQDGLVSRTRNIFGSRMVASSDFTHLLMADADIGFEPEVVERLVLSGHHVAGACVPLREVKWPRVRDALDRVGTLDPAQLESSAHIFAVSFLPSEATGSRKPVNGFLPVRYLGGAMLLATREVFVRLAESTHVDRYESGTPFRDWDAGGWTFFDPFVEPDDRIYLSEDYAFCRRWRDIGGAVMVDLVSTVTHTGSLTVHGDIALSLRTAALPGSH